MSIQQPLHVTELTFPIFIFAQIRICGVSKILDKQIKETSGIKTCSKNV